MRWGMEKMKKKILPIIGLMMAIVLGLTACMEALLEDESSESGYEYGEEFAGPGGEMYPGGPGDGWYGDEYGYGEYGDGYGPYGGYGEYGDGWDGYGGGYGQDYGNGYGDDWGGYGQGYGNGYGDDWGGYGQDYGNGYGGGWSGYGSEVEITGDHYYPYDENLGTVKELSGDIAVVSIFVKDKTTSWNFNSASDQKLYQTVYSNLSIAVDYLEKNSKSYGKTVNFIYDWEKYPELTYDLDINVDYRDIDRDYNRFDNTAFRAIEENVPTESILKDLNTDQILYMMFFNTPSSNTITSCTRNYYQGMVRPYEICYMFMNCNGDTDCPSNFAHEMLHSFGAPDLYMAEDYNITQEYVRYAEQIELNDIMRINHDLNIGDYVYDRITNEITDITAYYAGLTDYSETVDQWGFAKSQHDN